MKPNRLMSGVIILSCLAAVSATGCREGGTIVSSEDRNIPVMKLYPETIEVPRSFVADIQAIQFVEVKSKVGGFIKEIHVDEGQKVSKGDVLFKLDAIEYYEAVREAEAALKQAEAEYQMTAYDVDRISRLVEKEILADYIAGQASDGWGESVEQRDIEVDDGVLNVHLWNSSQNWTIKEEERFSQDFHTQLPDLCWSVRLGEGDLIYIKKGESGYKRSKMSTKDKAQNRYLADYNNRRRGITRPQEQAMLTGCMHGWDVPMADPVVQEKVLGAKSSLEMKGL